MGIEFLEIRMIVLIHNEEGYDLVYASSSLNYCVSFFDLA
ncbi:hypothetical protein lwe0861 [Listeria welshimeri serovar 6b str. SLCC5334]|uniref:Uncharacterized protein n=1 Tax=Listeria welshimeri serovar 6b (strain ATCC 35897 / DSM 20650 / CCUG 15529 / CIP 8149 / NCTC 11857 / SLCC 5334 / V8) TaxID=386043 RepID=A0AGZ7_LISW6|nr:hypothetical protein lwe0861 [Listeria welshimeri serovar 6b str. SLCC5334]